jgi:hypothetical protein
MGDSLDLLLTRQPSAGRRAAPVSSPQQHFTGSSGSFTRATGTNNKSRTGYADMHGDGISYNSITPKSPAAVTNIYSSQNCSYSPSLASACSNLKIKADADTPSEKEVRANQRTQCEDSSASLSNSSTSALGASLANSLASKLSGDGSASGPVNWSSFKAKQQQQRAGSANTISPKASNDVNKTPFVQTGPKSAAAGLCDIYVKSQSQETKPWPRPDDTVIEGAVIFPLRSPTTPKIDDSQSAMKRNPFSTPAVTSIPTRPGLNTAPGPVRAAPVSAVAPAVPGEQPMGRCQPVFSCPDCGRSFKRGSLIKHQKICKKVFKQKREVFDSSKLRTQEISAAIIDGEEYEEEECEGDDEAAARPRTAAPMQPQQQSKPAEEVKEQSPCLSKANWKDQSESLREAMRRAKASKKNQPIVAANAMGIDMRAMMPKAK